MFDFLKSKEENPPEWLEEMSENKERWFVFLDKLENRMDELGTAAVPELIEAYNSKNDPYHQAWYTMSSGIKGQYKSIMDKVRAVKEEKINDFFNYHINQVKFDGKYRTLLYNFREDCLKRENVFEDKYHLWQEKIDATADEDLELKYQNIISEYEGIKNSFSCKQCGAPLLIEKIYFISTYISCTNCQTQNTFEPSTQAQQLEHLGRRLAEKRTAHLLKAYQQENKPALYEIYLREMFNEWNKIVPDLSEQNERFYESQLRQFRKYNN